MINILLCFLIVAIIAAGSYYAAYQWVNLRHNRNELADEFKRATEHIQELETRIELMEADKALNEYKNKPQADNSGWNNFEVRS